MDINLQRFAPLYLSTLLLASFCGTVQAEIYNCKANPTWFSSPSMPTEVAKNGKDGSSNFCDFYQFSWQAFAYLMSPSQANPAIKNFQDTTQFKELEINADGTPANSCDGIQSGNTLFVRVSKSQDAGAPFVIPERINQAGGGATIYDQNGNVVYYDVKFSKNMCNVSEIKKLNNFPNGTTELKTAWKVLKPGEESKYLTMKTNIGKDTALTTLGMIGFHLAIATTDHPEFVWATFEHNTNAPDCNTPATTAGWSFASSQCATALENKDNLGVVQCQFNNAKKQTDPTKVTGTPTQICREYAYGSEKSDLKYAENVGDITSLNRDVTQYLTGHYAVLKNYFNVGALWVSDITQDSSPQNGSTSNQRGSLRLANTVAETDHQNVDLNPATNQGFASNCFGCHGYSGTKSIMSNKNTTSGGLSHIFDDIAVGMGQCLDVQASQLINNQSDAKNICPSTCTNSSSKLTWNGQWTNQGVPMTVCGCCGKK
ncbi:mannan-binding lectin [Crenothrix polyspora]|uniref:Mannan-binding protein domain-containing protein n=1 Tax=Crenothrix polyspora TaxID=360316 RepID=A0A1R4H3S7_9GAMM|nr:mannan-binding lectin [Crenothrix polyspora]SJM90691.1 conserved exported hypothetical protein [Crenothrix polyspora]